MSNMNVSIEEKIKEFQKQIDNFQKQLNDLKKDMKVVDDEQEKFKVPYEYI